VILFWSRVDGVSVDDGLKNLCVEELLRGGGGDVAVEDDEVGEEAGLEAAFFFFAEVGEGGALGVGVKGFVEGEFFLGLVGFGPGFVLASDGGVEAAEGIDGLDGVVGAEGEGDVVGEHGAPGVGVLGSVGAEAVGGPVHVGEEMGGLHGGDDAEFGVGVEVGREEDLGVLDAEAVVAGLNLETPVFTCVLVANAANLLRVS
jgi:hypothetical protein